VASGGALIASPYPLPFCTLTLVRRCQLAAVPFCHLGFACKKPRNISHLWKAEQYPADPRHVGEHIKKRRFDMKMTLAECRGILGVSKGTLIGWEKGAHKPQRRMRERIVAFLGCDPF